MSILVSILVGILLATGRQAWWAEHTGNAPAAQDCIAGRSVQPQAGLGALCSVPCPIHVIVHFGVTLTLRVSINFAQYPVSNSKGTSTQIRYAECHLKHTSMLVRCV